MSERPELCFPSDEGCVFLAVQRRVVEALVEAQREGWEQRGDLNKARRAPVGAAKPVETQEKRQLLLALLPAMEFPPYLGESFTVWGC